MKNHKAGSQFVKIFKSKAVSIDEDKRQARFIISDDSVDRMEERVEQSWKLDNYEKNPIVLWGHDPSAPDNVLGTSFDIKTEDKDGVTQTSASVQFAAEGTSKGVDTVWSLVKQGILRTVSVGFIPRTFKTDEEDHDVLADNELLEWSIVPIPANPRAVALSAKEGYLSSKDISFLKRSYESELKYLQDELDSDSIDKNKEKSMSDEDIQKLAEALGTAVADKLTPISDKLDKVLEAVSGESDDDSDEGDGSATPPAGEGDGTEGDGTKSTKPNKAKSEQNDEDGADDGELTEDSELTEEQAEEFEKEFNNALKEIQNA